MSAIAAQQTRSTQKQRVLAALRAHPTGVCLLEVDADLSYTLRNRCSELLRAGYPIIARRCRYHQHSGPVSRYSLSGSPEQMELVLRRQQ